MQENLKIISRNIIFLNVEENKKKFYFFVFLVLILFKKNLFFIFFNKNITVKVNLCLF